MSFNSDTPSTALAVDDDLLILEWPKEAERAAEHAGSPMLLLVAPDGEPPSHWGPLTDWVRLPADERDIRARANALRRKYAPDTPPVVDEYGVLRRGGAWVALSPIEARLVARFLESPTSVLSRRHLGLAGWPEGIPNDRSVDSYIKSLRRRISPIGLHIHTVRRHGYLLEIEPTSGASSER